MLRDLSFECVKSPCFFCFSISADPGLTGTAGDCGLRRACLDDDDDDETTALEKLSPSETAFRGLVGGPDAVLVSVSLRDVRSTFMRRRCCLDPLVRSLWPLLVRAVASSVEASRVLQLSARARSSHLGGSFLCRCSEPTNSYRTVFPSKLDRGCEEGDSVLSLSLLTPGACGNGNSSPTPIDARSS